MIVDRNAPNNPIFFKNKYPQARIIAFEPDPNIFKVLNKNMQLKYLFLRKFYSFFMYFMIVLSLQ